jgi:hypothetical protein
VSNPLTVLRSVTPQTLSENVAPRNA